MLGFLKKKKKDDPKAPDATAETQDKTAQGADSEPPAPEAPPKKKKGVSIKKLIFILMILGAVGGSGYFVYSRYFAAPEPGTRIYTPVPLAHVKLPPEILAFSFEHFPDLYDALVAFNGEVTLFEDEISRIEAVGTQYPEQKKIAESQKKVWVKGKNTLLKIFTKLEKPIKETFVLYQVNKTRGQEQIQARTSDLTTTAQQALKAAREQTAELKERMSGPPEGMVHGTLYKIKKIFQ